MQQPQTASGLRSILDRATAQAGLAGKFTTKDIRPMAITARSLAGYPNQELQVDAAHAKITTSQGYIKMRVTPTSNVGLEMPTTNCKS